MTPEQAMQTVVVLAEIDDFAERDRRYDCKLCRQQDGKRALFDAVRPTAARLEPGKAGPSHVTVFIIASLVGTPRYGMEMKTTLCLS